MWTIVVRHLPALLIVSAFPLLWLTGRPFSRKTAPPVRHDKFRSLRVSSPVVSTLVAIAVVGKPFLEHLRDNDWQSDMLGPWPLLAVVMVISASIYAAIGAILYFFFRALQNINTFSERKVRQPYSAFLLLIPITNLITTPYLEYFLYHRSKALVPEQKVSRLAAAVLAVASFALIVIGLVCGMSRRDPLAEAGSYDPRSLFIIGTCTTIAGGILFTRIIDGIHEAQETYAHQAGALAGGAAAVGDTRWRGVMAGLKTACAAVLVVIALAAAVYPGVVSHALERASAWLTG